MPLWTLLWALLQVLRIRLTAVLYWIVPALVLSLAGGLAFLAIPTHPLASIAALLSVSFAGLTIALGLSAPVIAVATILRSGENPRWTPAHTLPALLGITAILPAFASGPSAVLVVMVATLSMVVVTVRLGRKADGRRMAASRALVGSVAAGTSISLTLHHLFQYRQLELASWANPTLVPVFQALDLQNTLLADAGVVAMLVVVATLCLPPVANQIVDARSAVGWLLSGFLIVPVVLALTPATLTIVRAQKPIAPAIARSLALEKAGTQLVEIDGAQPWHEGPRLSIGVYWIEVNDKRILPFRDGRIDEDQVVDGVVEEARRALYPYRGKTLVIELERRANMKRLRPLLRSAQAAEIDHICFVVRAKDRSLGCVPLSLDVPPEDGVHVLLSPESATWIDGQDTEEMELAALLLKDADVLVAHVDDDVGAVRLLSLLAMPKAKKVLLFLAG